MSHVRIVNKIPEEIFDSALDEVMLIDWNNLPKAPAPDIRKTIPVFSTSTALHLRVHEQDPYGPPMSREELSEVINCVDLRYRSNYPNINKLVSWIEKEVQFTRLGRIMLVRLSPGGSVPTHIDTGSYFGAYYRLHVPFVTNSDVLFYGDTGSDGIHMQSGYLSQLDNRRNHSVVNGSSDHARIHLIVDIASDQSRLKL